jgi:hypothetical protein
MNGPKHDPHCKISPLDFNTNKFLTIYSLVVKVTCAQQHHVMFIRCWHILRPLQSCVLYAADITVHTFNSVELTVAILLSLRELLKLAFKGVLTTTENAIRAARYVHSYA